jgi:hypothetical protein
MACEKGLIMTTATSPAFSSDIPFVHERVGAAAIYCSDGRYGEQMDDFLHNGLLLPHYDRVAIPGGAACLGDHAAALRERGALQRQLQFLMQSHGLSRVVLIAHQDCGFYKQNVHPYRLKQRALTEFQFADLRRAAETIRGWEPHPYVDAYIARREGEKVCFDGVEV